ncbi:TnsD family Tn7-like transposition protein [Paraburkholderia sp. CNPSo 3076]|uniref:TnsD family Tn7-like transposition protein n=1 Tax=Paraburkholderia sp. CNPSo 3076 TaxID=2940936 RepID=UPI002251C0ED|nr:TnsD family Tn7-like transposition protein [Paraburkholderia sp. CNPSo 3076]MCX5538072.1 TnsD family Tn7-like transposition protein [Paraburkholderia sp. CNPSo 3076]
MATSLFPLQDGETLENNIIRYAEYMGLASTQDLRRRLFGYPCRAGTRFPCGISHLALQTRDYWGLDADQIIEHNTEFNYMTMMASSALRSSMRAIMQNPPGVGVLRMKRKLTLERDSRPRYCDECLADWNRSGIAPYCKISHQLPGTYYCDVHLTPLKAAGESRGDVVLAAMLQPLVRKSDSAAISDVTAAEAKAIKSVAIKSARQQTNGDTRERVHYLSLVRDAGFLMPDGRLRKGALANDLRVFFGVTYCRLTGLDERKIAAWWNVVRGQTNANSLRNPFVFLAAESLLESRISCPGTHLPLIPSVSIDEILPILPKCAGALHRDCDSYGAMVRGRTAQRWKVTCSCGMTYKILTNPDDSAVHIVPLEYGERYKQHFDVLLSTDCGLGFAAHEIGISLGTAVAWKRIKASPGGTKAVPKKRLPQAEIKELRGKWRALVLSAPPKGRIRSAYSKGAAIYRKLALHDHEWLIKFNKSQSAPSKGMIHRSRNQLTEARLQHVREAYDDLIRTEPPVHITRSAIVRKAGFTSAVEHNGSWKGVFSQLSETKTAYVERVCTWFCELPRARRPRNCREFERLTHCDWQSLSDEQRHRVRTGFSSARS